MVEARKAHAVGYNFGRNEHLREVKAGVLVVVSAFSWGLMLPIHVSRAIPPASLVKSF